MLSTEVFDQPSTAMPPFRRVDGDAGLLKPEIGDVRVRPIANITFSEAMLEPLERCVVNSLPCLSTLSMVHR